MRTTVCRTGLHSICAGWFPNNLGMAEDCTCECHKKGKK